MNRHRSTTKKKIKLKKIIKKTDLNPPSNKDHAAHKNTTGNKTTLSAIFIGDVIPKQSFGFGLELNVIFCFVSNFEFGKLVVHIGKKIIMQRMMI